MAPTVARASSTIEDWRRDPWDEPEELAPEELEPLPPERKGGRRLGLAFLAIVVVLCLLAGMAGRWAIKQVAPPGEPGDPVNFTVNEGETIDVVRMDGSDVREALVGCPGIGRSRNVSPPSSETMRIES